ncbi:hypothetical protein GDO81_025632 [Engystomops pustulosus]|uniref:Secreted protein n=1 Tax=Engystomops pustulosus TaxID=76066 RepID=A0AAV6YI83_ENGPU|nr:hypothetical protein GDO81_025632 [Engystomops pustulosus]
MNTSSMYLRYVCIYFIYGLVAFKINLLSKTARNIFAKVHATGVPMAVPVIWLNHWLLNKKELWVKMNMRASRTKPTKASLLPAFCKTKHIASTPSKCGIRV